MRPRKSLPDDHENIQKAYDLIQETMYKNNNIESTLWSTAVWFSLLNGYKNCGISYEEFVEESSKVIKHYKSWWIGNGE